MNNQYCYIIFTVIIIVTICSPPVCAESAEYWCEKGIDLHDLEMFPEALEAFNQAIEINPYNDDYWFWKGATLYDLELYDEALEALKLGLEVDPTDPNLWQRIGLSLINLNRNVEAITAFDNAIDNAEGIDEVAANGWNGKGNALLSLGRYEEALIAYDITLNIDPNREHVISLRNSIINDLMN